MLRLPAPAAEQKQRDRGCGGFGRAELPDSVQQVQDAMWQPEYCLIQAC